MNDIYSRLEITCDSCGFLFGSVEKNILAEIAHRCAEHSKELNHKVRINLISTIAVYPDKRS